MSTNETIRKNGFLLPLCDAVTRRIGAVSLYRLRGTSLVAGDVMTLAVFACSLLTLLLFRTGTGWAWAQWLVVGYLGAITVTRSFEAAVLELWRNPEHRRVSNARSFLHVCVAYLTLMTLFGAAYRLAGVSFGEALELTVSFSTNLGNNVSLDDPLVRALRLAESLVGTLYLVVMIGRFGGAFSKKEERE